MSKESNRITAAILATATLATGGYIINGESIAKSSIIEVAPGISSSKEALKNLSFQEFSSSIPESKVISSESKVSSEVEVVSSKPNSIIFSSSEASSKVEVVSSKPEEIVYSSPEVYPTSSEFAEMENVTVIEYGKSELGRPLEAMLIQPTKEVKKTVLLTFALHGFEGAYPRDGQVLVDLGKALIKYFAENPDQLGNTALYIIPSANPDGLIDGTTDNGFGRCQASGVDLNRDFDYNWEKEYSSRNKTLFPFSCPESRALRDFLLKIKPNDLIDFHGWLDASYGNKELCKMFNNLGIYWDNVLGTPGYWTSYGKKYCQRVALIELPDPKSSPTDPQKMIQSITYLCNQ